MFSVDLSRSTYVYTCMHNVHIVYTARCAHTVHTVHIVHILHAVLTVHIIQHIMYTLHLLYDLYILYRTARYCVLSFHSCSTQFLSEFAAQQNNRRWFPRGPWNPLASASGRLALSHPTTARPLRRLALPHPTTYSFACSPGSAAHSRAE